MRRVAYFAGIASLLISAACAAYFGHSAWTVTQDNAAIRALVGGKDVELRAGAHPNTLYARALYFAVRDRTEEAQEMLAQIPDSEPQLVALAQYAIGNARLRAAFEKIDAGAFDDAVPEVNLAKSAYRAALHAQPDNMNAKVSLELAMRLVRDLPRPEQEGNPDEETQPRRLWTDLPGLPRGAP